MIKKLRRRIISITTVLLTAILVVVLAFMFQAAKTGLENDLGIGFMGHLSS